MIYYYFLNIIEIENMRTSCRKDIFDSFQIHELVSEKENEVKSQMKRMKSPYLKKIDQAKKHFQSIKTKFQRRSSNQPEEVTATQLPKIVVRENQTSNQTTDRPFNEPQRMLTEQSNEDAYFNQERQPNFKEWALQPNQKSLFNKKSELMENYTNIFEKKVKSPKWELKGQSFKIQEKHIIQRIFNEIGDVFDHTVGFTEVIQFFEKCPLFYHIYNIHPNSLINVINESAHKYENKLTQQEFMNLFLLNSRTNLDYQNYNIEKITKRCVVDEQTWKDLKEVFTIFDTFGNQTVQFRQFIQKLKISLPLKYLLQKQVLYFPSINRSYQLKKIMFDIQHKLNMNDKFVRWEDIKKLIANFEHIKQPTIDVIEKKYLAAGKITHFTNTFMLKDQILTFIKEVYNRSPKYCDHFVKVSNFCDQIYDSTESKHYLPEIVRNDPQKVTFSQSLIKLKGYQYQYLDLDEILQWFSIKDVSKEADKALLRKMAELESSSDSDEEFNKKRKADYKKNKNIQNLPIKFNPNIEYKQITKVEQFKLTKKKKQPTIREKKVQQMIKEKQEKQKKQCQKKIKANSIPSSTNHEKYIEYKQKMQKNKDVILSKLNHVNERDIFILKYLQANTKLFEKPKIQEKQEQKYVFQPKPIPWFVQINLLEKIQQEKQDRIRDFNRQNKKKYLREWKNLPNFLQQMNIISQAVIQKNGSQSALLNELQGSKNTSKRGVKQVPNFKQLHKRFLQQLQKKKNIIKPTVIKQFHLTSPKQSNQSSQIVPKEYCSPSNKTNKSYIPQCNNFIGSTMKYQALVKLNQEKKLDKQKKIDQQIEANKERKRNQKLFAKYMRKQLLKQFKLINGTHQTHKQRKQFQKDHKDEIAQIYKRVFKRPFLFQSKSNGSMSNEILESRAKPVQLNEESPNKIYEIISDLGSQRIEADIKKTEEKEQLSHADRNSY